MSRDPVTVSPDDTLARALELTRAHRIRHLPVVGAGKVLCGIVSDRDIRLAMPSPLAVADADRAEFLASTSIAEVMSREVVTIGANETIEDAARQLYRHRISALPVIDSAERLLGIITETDILHAFVLILGGAEPASRVEIAIEDRPGELARALHVVGAQQAVNVISIVVPSIRAQSRKTAILHLATIDPRETLDALERAGFEVGWPSLDHDLRAGPGA